MVRFFFLFLFFISYSLIAQNCEPNFTGFIPISDLGKGKFNGFIGGKYSNGSNLIPNAHYQKGKELAKKITPLDTAGNSDLINGKIGFLILGYSTAAMTGRFLKNICNYRPLNKNMEIIIGAQGGKDINSMVQLNSDYYKTIDTILAEQKMSAAQVQMVWISTGDIYAYQLPFPDQSFSQIEKYRLMLSNLKKLYPNLQLVYCSDRPYAGYIGETGEGPKELKEPSAYYSSWTIKWLIERQINTTPNFTYADLPFIDWGPSLWTDGSKGNKYGYTWNCDDAGKGGIHASSKGRMREAAMMWWWLKKYGYLEN